MLVIYWNYLYFVLGESYVTQVPVSGGGSRFLKKGKTSLLSNICYSPSILVISCFYYSHGNFCRKKVAVSKFVFKIVSFLFGLCSHVIAIVFSYVFTTRRLSPFNLNFFNFSIEFGFFYFPFKLIVIEFIIFIYVFIKTNLFRFLGEPEKQTKSETRSSLPLAVRPPLRQQPRLVLLYTSNLTHPNLTLTCFCLLKSLKPLTSYPRFKF